MLNTKQKLTLFKLLAQGVEHKVSSDELFLLVAQQGPKELKSACEAAAIEVAQHRTVVGQLHRQVVVRSLPLGILFRVAFAALVTAAESGHFQRQ